MPMRFGFSHHPTEHQRRHVALIAEAEGFGFDFAWLPDQTFHRDPYILLAACAGATERLQLGLAVTNPYTRHPVVTARCAATVAEVAPERFQVAFGAGNRRELLTPLGLEPFDPAGSTRELVTIVRGLLRGEELHFVGEYFRADGVELELGDLPPVPPLYIAGRGRKMLQAAGAVGDGAIIGGLSTPAGIAYAYKEMGRGAAEVGRSLDGLEVVSWISCTLTEDRAAALETVKPMVAHIIGGAPASMLREVGLPDETIAAVKDEYGRTGKEGAAALVTDLCVDTFTLVGGADECLERIRALEDAGVTQFGMLLPPGDVDAQRERLRQFAAEVIEPYRAS